MANPQKQQPTVQAFRQGDGVRAYEYFGTHRQGNVRSFRVWAPHAQYVSLCGDFTDWQTDRLPMTRVLDGETDTGVWEILVDAALAKEGDCYKYFIRNGCRELYKADPYAVRSEMPPQTASVVCELDGYAWRDEGWMQYRKTHFTREHLMREPINVYELHAGSWKRHGDGRPYSYRELAAELVVYVKQMGYTHVELMPIAEHPFDGSWGYQVTGYYAATARFGEPHDLMAFVDTMHEAGIGVIWDWVPAHFPKDAHGLYEFDGQPLYEYSAPERMGHPTWGTRYFDLGKGEIQSFLISNACFWAEKFHVDGLRADAVSSMLYLDYDRRPGEWYPNRFGDNRNLEAIEFFKRLNRHMMREHPDVMMIAEESGGWHGVTQTDGEGLGFSLQWSMGWMRDALSYLSEDPLFRKHRHEGLVNRFDTAFDERYVLPVSHDEVVHGKRSLLDRAVGDYAQKFATERVFLTYMMTHPGKKLTFMGCEIGQFGEWDHTGQTEWSLLGYDMHAAMQLFVAELNHFYLEHPPLWQRDADAEGFAWIDAHDADQSIFSYRRRDARGAELTVLLNFTPVEHNGFRLSVPKSGIYEEVLNTDEVRFGGRGRVNAGRVLTETCDGTGEFIRIRVAPMSATVFRSLGRMPKKRRASI